MHRIAARSQPNGGRQHFSLPPPLSTKTQGGLRGILYGQKRVSPASWVNLKPDVKPRVNTVDGLRTQVQAGGTQDPGMGGLMSNLNLEVKDEVQMDELGKTTGDIMMAQMEILAGEVDADSREDTMGDDLEEEGSSGGRGTCNPRAPENKTGAHIVYLSQGSDEMHLGSVVVFHHDGGGILTILCIYKVWERSKLKENFFPLWSITPRRGQSALYIFPHTVHVARSTQVKKDRRAEKLYLKQMAEFQHQRLDNKKLEKLFSESKIKSLQLSLALGGLVAGLAVLGTLFRSGTMSIWSIRFICDNESAVTAARRPKSESIFQNTRCDWDLIATIQDLIVRWCKGIALSFHWVKGHADRINHPLTRDERLNIEADIQADVI
jgi:hypothetical protein